MSRGAAWMAAATAAGCSYLPPLSRGPVQLLPQERHAPAVILEDERTVDSGMWGVEGSVTEIVYRKIYIATAEGMRYAELSVPYGPGAEIEHLNGRTVTPDGRVFTFDEHDVLDAEVGRSGGARGGAYRVMTYPFPGAAPGCVVEYSFERSRDHLLLSEHYAIGDDVPIRRAVYEIEGYGPVRRARAGGGFTQDARRQWRWVAENVAAYGAVSFSPPARELRPWVSFAVSRVEVNAGGAPFSEDVYRDWRAVGNALWHELGPFVRDHPPLTPAAGGDAVGWAWREVQARIHDRAGLSADSAETAATVLAQGFGGANERALVLWSFLLAAGVDAALLAVPGAGKPDAAEDFPTPEVADDFLVRVAGAAEALVLDPACLGCAPGELVPQHRDRVGMLVHAPKDLQAHDLGPAPELVASGSGRQADQPTELDLDVRIGDRGLLARTGTLRARGEAAAEIRWWFAQHPPTEAATRDYMRRRYLDGIHEGRVHLEGLDDLGGDMVVRLENILVRREGFVSEGGWIVVPLAAFAGEPWLDAFEADRPVGVYFAEPPDFAHRFSLEVPAGYSVAEAPAAAKIATRFGQYTLASTQGGGKVRFEERLTLKVQRVELADYQEFLKFVEAVRAARGTGVALRR